MNTPRLILAVGVAFVGTVFTVLTLMVFDRQIHTESTRLHQANHRSALKIINRDVEDLRRQLVQMHASTPANNFDFLFFDRNGAGRMGVHGPTSATWTPISNAYTSIFRAAFEGLSGSAMRIHDLTGNLIDANNVRAKGSSNELADFVKGTNLVLRSSALPGHSMPGLSLLVFLTLLFWADVGMFIYFITPDGEPSPVLAGSRPLALPARGYRLHDPVVLEGIRDQHYRRL